MQNVAVNGIGTIGKRVAEAVDKQEDMELVGVSDVAPSGELRTVLENGALRNTPLYGSTPDAVSTFEDDGINVEGTIDQLLEQVDVVVDATPPGVDMDNRNNLYKPNDVKAIFQGGSDSSIAPVSFNAHANFNEAKGKQFARVVSCNTTSLCRTLHSLDGQIGVGSVTANLVRRGGDPKQDGRGPINSIKPVPHVPSHHGPDVKEVMPGMDITTLAVKVPTTLAHVHMVTAELEDEADADDVRQVFDFNTRIRLEWAEDGYGSTGKVIEKMRDLHRPRYDMNEATVWADTVDVEEGVARWIHMVHQESIVVPDNIDAIRALGGETDRRESILRTNQALGL